MELMKKLLEKLGVRDRLKGMLEHVFREDELDREQPRRVFLAAPSGDATNLFRHAMQRGEYLALDPDGHGAFVALLEDLEEAPEIRSRFDSDALAMVIESVLARCVAHGLGADQGESELRDLLTAPTAQFHVFAPLQGIELVGEPLKLGRMKLHGRTSPAIADVTRKLPKAWQEDGVGISPMGQCWTDASAYLEAEVKAVQGSQQTVAAAYMEDALDYLRAYAERTAYHPLDFAFGMFGGAGAGVVTTASFSAKGQLVGMGPSPLVPGHPVILGPADVDMMRRYWGYDGVDRLLGMPLDEREDEAHEMPRRLTLALRWLGRAQQTPNFAIKAVSYWTALETLLVPESEGIRGLMATRLSWLLDEYWPHLKWPRDRLGRWSKSVAYDIRCRVIHGGEVRLGGSKRREVMGLGTFALAAIGVIADNLEQWPTIQALVRAVH